MAKKKRKSAEQTGHSKEKEETTSPGKGTSGAPTDDEDDTGFGGIPARDLKKNLGCGG